MSFMCFEFVCKKSLGENLFLDFESFMEEESVYLLKEKKIHANKIEKEKKKIVKRWCFGLVVRNF